MKSLNLLANTSQFTASTFQFGAKLGGGGGGVSKDETTYCGYVAIIGRPNVGKSTLMNKILGEKISITSHKPQTTRHQILGIKTENDTQIIYVDTPGLHRETKRALNRYMVRTAQQALKSVDVIGFVVEGLRWTEEDEWILERLKKIAAPVILIINKIDQVHPRAEILPHLAALAEKMNFIELVPLSAKTGENINALETIIRKFLPAGPFLFSDAQLTDRSERFLASEVIREKLTRYLHQELPYALTVEIEEFKTKGAILHISALIWLEREGQKPIVIGDKGERLKLIGQRARLSLERLFGQKVFLQLWTKVKENWSDDVKALQSLGYKDER